MEWFHWVNSMLPHGEVEIINACIVIGFLVALGFLGRYLAICDERRRTIQDNEEFKRKYKL